MILSIVMMVKNEEKNLERTLISLNKIRNFINSELIILDTGSTDATIDIAKKFTDKVYYNQWNGDFAYMRNKAISYAIGKWLLMLDADEELIEGSELINFFNSGKFKGYKSGSILLRNLTSIKDEKEYSTSKILRVFENYKGFRYEGTIHEQPLFKEPIYESPLGKFNHYGYLYEDEELRQRKIKRNRELLLNELKKKPYDSYVNYQLGKDYLISEEIQIACDYLEKSLALYKKEKLKADYVYENLAKAYLKKYDYSLCEKLCREYIREFNENNIDIYYFLAKAQFQMNNLEESKSSYERYLYLLENYEDSAQSKSLFCEGTTVSMKKNALIDILMIYYRLKQYKEVILKYDELLEDFGQDREVDFFLIDSLYKIDNFKMVRMYYEKCVTESDRKDFIIAIEKFILTLGQEFRGEVYRELQSFPYNYGRLNKIRTDNEKDIDVFKEILIEEKQNYYGDIVYESIKRSLDITELLKDIDGFYIEEYINYMVSYKRDSIIVLYDYLMDAPITLNEKKIKVYKSIAKALLFNGNLLGEKYEKVFSIYNGYNYFSLKNLYNSKLNNSQLLDVVMDLDHRFILKLNVIEDFRKTDRLLYVKSLKDLLLEYPAYRKGIEILIDRFQKELETGEELNDLKAKYKAIIESHINCGRLKEASKLIMEYEKIYGEEADTLNMKFIVGLLNNDIKDGENLLKKALFLNINDFNTLFNIAYLKEASGDFEEALRFYEKVHEEAMEEDIILETQEKIDSINQNLNCI